MSESLLSDLTDVKLIAKEQHRRKRRLTKLNKSKRQRLLSEQQNDNHKYGKFKYERNSKYNQEWVLNVYLDISTNTTTATVIIDDYYYCSYYDEDDISYHHDQEIQTQQHHDNDINNDNNNKQRKYTKKESEDDDNEDISISTHFESIEYDYFFSKNLSKKTYLKFPSTFICHIQSLYESSSISTEQNDINGLLNSARSWNNNHYGQVVVIGTYLDELIKIFKENTDNILPMDIIYTISEFTGSAIIWLRKPGLNIFKWSVNTKIKYQYNYNLNKQYNKKRNLRKWKFKIKNNKLKKDEFYFSGYIGNDLMMKELLLLNDANNNKYNQYLDLDWCFVAFLLLGLIPKYQNSYFKWYFNQKLLSALSPSFPFKYLLKQ